MQKAKCTKIPLPGEIYSIRVFNNPERRTLVKVVHYKDISPANTLEPLEYREWQFVSETLEHKSKAKIGVNISVYNPEDKCLIWSLLREPTLEDLSKRVVFDE